MGTATLRAEPFLLLSCFLSYKRISFWRKRGATSVGDQSLETLGFIKLVDNTDWFTTVRSASPSSERITTKG